MEPDTSFPHGSVGGCATGRSMWDNRFLPWLPRTKPQLPPGFALSAYRTARCIMPEIIVEYVGDEGVRFPLSFACCVFCDGRAGALPLTRQVQ